MHLKFVLWSSWSCRISNNLCVCNKIGLLLTGQAELEDIDDIFEQLDLQAGKKVSGTSVWFCQTFPALHMKYILDD